jgi:hypothetical protein
LSKSCNAQGYSKIKNNLPNPAVITSPREIAYMICISEQRGDGPRIGYSDLHRLVLSVMTIMCGYGLDMFIFQRLDKFLRRAASATKATIICP